MLLGVVRMLELYNTSKIVEKHLNFDSWCALHHPQSKDPNDLSSISMGLLKVEINFTSFSSFTEENSD